MIKLKMSIEDISEYQTGILPKSAVKIETPQSIEEMMKKAAPIAAVLCVLMFVTMLCKTVMNKTGGTCHSKERRSLCRCRKSRLYRKEDWKISHLKGNGLNPYL